MLFFELFVPRGTITDERRRRIGERLISDVVDAGDAPPAAQQTARAMRTLSWLAVQEIDAWFVDGQPVEAGDMPRYLVRVTVTAGALTDPNRTHVVERVTRALAETDDDGRRLYDEPDACIHLVEVPDDNWGACGRVMHCADIVELIQSRRAAMSSG